MQRESVYKSRHLAGRVLRYSTWPTIRQPTVAEHCWRVACIYVEVFGMPRAEVLYYALHHDSGELWAGDLPFMVKAKTPGLREAMNVAEQIGLEKLGVQLPEITDQERAQIKIADLLEMHEFGLVEYQMGNMYAQPIVSDTLKEVDRLAKEFGVRGAVGDWTRREGIR